MAESSRILETQGDEEYPNVYGEFTRSIFVRATYEKLKNINIWVSHLRRVQHIFPN